MEISISEYSDPSPDYTVLSLNRRVGELLDIAFPGPVWLKGELASTPRANPRGHTYFQLVDPSPDGLSQPLSVIDCVLFAGERTTVVREFARNGQVFTLDAGMSLRISGRVSLWDKGGRYQFIVQRIDPVWTLGSQALRLRNLVEKMSDEGILRANEELHIPKAPLNVGLITARDSAASHDFLQGLRDSGFPFRVYAAWSAMQGENTAEEVLRAFNRLLEVPDIDVVVLTRGGGSPTDLAWFNNEHIGRIISQVPWPVISGIGHETDNTLPDFTAHTRAKTPTHAANILVNRMAELIGDIESLTVILQRSATRGISSAMNRLTMLAAGLSRFADMKLRNRFRDILTLETWLRKNTGNTMDSLRENLERHRQSLEKALLSGSLERKKRELNALTNLLSFTATGRIEKCSMILDGLEAVVVASDPQRLYRRGWATVRGKDGTLLLSVNKVEVNDEIQVSLRDGSIVAEARRIIPGKADYDGKDTGG